MAEGRGRDFAQVYLTIWDDEHFKALSQTAQWLYLLLLSQRKLEWSGVQPLNAAKWASLSSDATEAEIQAALDELADARFVVVDRLTAEVLIRSFFRKDVAKLGKNGKANDNLVKRALSDMNRVDSQAIRAALVTEARRISDRLPDDCLVRFPDLARPDTGHRNAEYQTPNNGCQEPDTRHLATNNRQLPPSPTGSRTPSPTGSRTPSPTPSLDGGAEP